MGQQIPVTSAFTLLVDRNIIAVLLSSSDVTDFLLPLFLLSKQWSLLFTVTGATACSFRVLWEISLQESPVFEIHSVSLVILFIFMNHL
jgi:hypothetical protein